jgi:hypothetical protein
MRAVGDANFRNYNTHLWVGMTRAEAYVLCFIDMQKCPNKQTNRQGGLEEEGACWHRKPVPQELAKAASVNT